MLLKMSRVWIYLLFQFLIAISLCHLKNVPAGSQQSFKNGLFNFYHSLILADGKETTIHLLKDIPKRYYFILREDRAPIPFTVTVTPCDVPIEWSILVHKTSTNFLGKTAHGNYDTQDISKSQKIPNSVSTVFNYKGNSAETYVGMTSFSAIYLIEFLSTERDTHITVYLTSDITSGHLYPELPMDPLIDVVGIGHTVVTLAWKHSPSVLQHKENIQYCILVNEKHNYKSLCVAETAIRSSGIKLPPTLSLSLSPDLLDSQQVMIVSKQELSVINKLNNGEVRQICMGTMNTYTVTNLSPSTQYYFDIFVVNLLTNASAAYTGTFARTLEEPDPKVTELKDGKIIHLTLDKKNWKFYNLQYQAKHKRVQFTFWSCSGQISVQITRNRKIVASENFAGLRLFSLKGKLMDTYLVQVRSVEQSNTSVKVQVSSHIHKPLFSALPDSLKIKSFSKLRTCNSVTIAWLGPQKQSKYCVYKKRIEEDQVWTEVRSTDRCSGPESRNKYEKVLCKYFYDRNLQRAVATETIKGLDAGTLYLFGVCLIGPSGIPVRYHSRVVKTRKKC
ncbi:PREDICTED: protein NDNF-like [Gavialis gangeticus]|uniref:protein NDNF-like n=1 Tax=Gavialis gangeticus TaxID=94835 RepID=UPI00092FC413|nr:PREDICTED: protein NDNF-like [Gavialis gangeticus]